MTYLLTMEPSSSLWDCSEFIATSYKLEVRAPARSTALHAAGPPGHDTGTLDVLCTPHGERHELPGQRVLHPVPFLDDHPPGTPHPHPSARSLRKPNIVAVLGTGAVGALAYTFTDTFWFSAIEGEVYALSSMFTALVVWLMLKWEEQADQPHSMRWIVLIAYLMGLSIGVHILNLLTVPALVFIYYFRKTQRITFKGIAVSTLISGAILVFINSIIIPHTVYIGALFDLFFVNSLGLPVNSGLVFFVVACWERSAWA